MDLKSSDLKDGFSTFAGSWHKFAATNVHKFKEAEAEDLTEFGKTLANNKQQLNAMAQNIQAMMADNAKISVRNVTDLSKAKPTMLDKVKGKVEGSLLTVALHERKGQISLVVHRMMKQSVLLTQGGSVSGIKDMLKEMGSDESIANETTAMAGNKEKGGEIKMKFKGSS